jgi:uncharacterized membrane protein
MAKPTGLHRLAPWRFLLFFAVLAAGWLVGQSRGLDWDHRTLVSFDVAALTFLASCASTFRQGPAGMRSLAERSDANRAVVLVLCGVLIAVILAALVGELGHSDKLLAQEKLLVFGSLVLAWTFGHAVCALHYAHLYYGRGDTGDDRGGLEFPGTPEPVMSDFAYFSYTLGVAAQTSDVQVKARHIRILVTIHSVVSFFFNVGALALAVNVLASH